MESRAPCACRDGVAHTAARGPSCLALDLPTLLSPKASLRRSPPLACPALPAPSALERCSQGSAKRPFIFLLRRRFASIGLKVCVGECHRMDRFGLSLCHAHSKPCIGRPCDCDLRPDVARGSAQETGLKPL